MWRMLQQDTPDDYVVGTGIKHSVRQLVEIAFGRRPPDREIVARARAAWTDDELRRSPSLRAMLEAAELIVREA